VSTALLRAGLRYQLRHPWQALLALLGICMGVAVVLAVDLANSAARASFAMSAEHVRGGATHRLTGADGKVPQALYAELFTSAGHPPMAPVISAWVRVEQHSERLQLIGVDVFAEVGFRNNLPGLIDTQGALGEWLSRPDAVALSASAATRLDVAPGSPVTLRYQGQSHPLQIFAIAEDDSVASRNLLLVDIATAQALTGLTGYVSHIDLILDEAAQRWIETRLPESVRLVSVEEQTAGVAGMSAAFELNLTAMSLLALLVGSFLIFNAMSFSIVQRRNLLGRLRAIGVRADEVFKLILAEAAALALLGTLAGCLLGVWLGQGLTRIVAATVSELYYQVAADAMSVGWDSLGKAVLLGIGGTLLATLLPARQAANTPPLTTLSRAALEQSTRRQLPRLALIGSLLVCAGLLIAFLLPGGLVVGFAGLFVLLLGAALLTPFGLRLAHSVLRRLPFAGVWRMATRDLDRHMSRLSTAAAALMVALAASVGVAVMVESMRDAVGDWLSELLSADLYIAAEGFSDGASLPPGVARQAPHLDTVVGASRYRNRELLLGNRSVQLVAAQLAAESRTGFDLVAVAGRDTWADFDAGAILISEPLAYRLALQPGDALNLPTPSGDSAFKITAVIRDFATEHGRIFMARSHYRQYWSDDRVDTLALFADSRGPAALYRAATERFSDTRHLVFTAAREIYRESMAVFDRTFRITEVLRLLSLLVAFVGILSALMALQLERRKEFAVLRAVGLTGRQLGLLIVFESVALGLLAAVIAIPTGLAMAWVLTAAIQLRAFGWTMPFHVDLLPLLLTLALGALAALLAGLYPAWYSSRHDPAPQLRED
jgi:putative ABC transport system permease protein